MGKIMRQIRHNIGKIFFAARRLSRSRRDGGCEAAIMQAWAALAVERFWRRFLPLLLVSLGFAACCWLNIFALLPLIPHLILLAIFAALFCGSAAFLYKFSLPQRAEALARLERDNHLQRGDLRLAGEIPANQADPLAAALWREHKRRVRASLPPLRSSAPCAEIPLYDRSAWRAAVFLLFAVAYMFSLGGSGGRLSDAFAFSSWQPAAAMRIDAWIDPPLYTRRPPVYLITNNNAAAETALSVPQGSRLQLRINNGGRRASLRCAGVGGKEQVREERREAASVYSVLLAQNSQCRLTSPVVNQTWALAAEPDKPPQIIWRKPPERALSGVLKLDYAAYDDYGLRKIWAEIRPAAEADPAAATYFARLDAPPHIIKRRGGELIIWQGRPIEAGAAAEAGEKAKPLIAPPIIPLALPRPDSEVNKGLRGGAASGAADFSQSPWAGAAAEIRLIAEDAAGHISISAPQRVILPQKIFINPLSRALAEQRRLLAENIAAAPRVADMIEAMLLRPEKTIADKGAALALFSLRARLRMAAAPVGAAELNAAARALPPAADEASWPLSGAAQIAAVEARAGQQREAALRDIVSYMGAIAEGIDKGKLAEAERRLALAAARLREALRNGASEREIGELMQNLREAMQDYIAMLAERGEADGGDKGGKLLGESDLDKRLKALEDAAKNGNRGLGEQLLAEFEDLMKNLQIRQGKGGDSAAARAGRQSQMQQQMDALSDIMRRQQLLLDDTHQTQERNLRGGAGAEQSREQQNQALDERQGKLRQDLQNLQNGLQKQGLAPKDGFAEAQKQMEEAQQALRQGNQTEAQENQSQSLQALRQSAQDVMAQMREALRKADAQAQQNGQGGAGDAAAAKAAQGQDPLGRPTGQGQTGQAGSLPSAAAQSRARIILEEIRKKLGNIMPPQEKSYLERLLNLE